MRLSELVEIRSGFTFRDSVTDMGLGPVAVIQAGDINSARLSQVARIAFIGDKHLLQEGDVVVSARGVVAARTITRDLLPAVATSSVFVLRPRSEALNPRFLSRYLNSISGQGALTRIGSGGYIKTLRKTELAELDIPLPLAATQDLIVNLGENLEEQQSLLELKRDLANRVYEGAIQSIIKETTE